eukprot:6134482-Pleurochrysis_carterae.AAC.1
MARAGLVATQRPVPASGARCWHHPAAVLSQGTVRTARVGAVLRDGEYDPPGGHHQVEPAALWRSAGHCGHAGLLLSDDMGSACVRSRHDAVTVCSRSHIFRSDLETRSSGLVTQYGGSGTRLHMAVSPCVGVCSC